MISSPQLPTTSDSVWGDEWQHEADVATLPSSADSDELEALHHVLQESRWRKTRAGAVIQHRAWKIGDTFKSEADHLDDTPLRSRSQHNLEDIPSSPPPSAMPSATSPIASPQTASSPTSKRPRRIESSDDKRPTAVGGFLIEDDSDVDDFAVAEPDPKRRMLEHSRHNSRDAYDSISDPSHNSEKGLESTAANESAQFSTATYHETVSEGLTRQIRSNHSLVPNEASELTYNAGIDVLLSTKTAKVTKLVTCSGTSTTIRQRQKAPLLPFEQLVATRSTAKAGRARKSYYGIDIHQLIDEAASETHQCESLLAKQDQEVLPSVECMKSVSKRSLMWTEKYRARHFLELCGDDRTHRQVLRWLKAWDPIVFPKTGKAPSNISKKPGFENDEEKAHKKILLLTGPPGLGKTTLAHVCARQAGYEVMEINASDERSSNVVKGRIRTSVGTESVKTGSTVTSKRGRVSKNAHPLCVVVDEVDGVVGGSGGSGEGGFIKALIDLILLDQKNSSGAGLSNISRKKKKGDNFKLMRPLILICNDVYHPSLRPLRQSSFAEIIHVRKPSLDAVVSRMKAVFEKEAVPCDSDAVRRLCEITWGVNAAESRRGKEGSGEGDLRGIMVVGEWAAQKLNASTKNGSARLTRKWVEHNMMSNLSHGGGGARGVGRGGTKELVNRVFLDGAGFPRDTNLTNVASEFASEQPKTQLGVAELAKKVAMDRLREMVDTSGDVDRVVTDIFSQYPSQPFNDDSILSKPDSAYEWLHFHDSCSSRVFTNQEFELAPYLSQPVLACHHLFASPARHHFGNAESKKWGEEEVEEEPLPFSGPRADYEAHEALKSNRDVLLALQGSLNATLLRSFRSPEDIATELLPSLVKMLTPDIKPIIVGGSGDQKGIASVRKEAEKALVKRAVDVMGAVGVVFERGKLEGEYGNRAATWVYRMEPPLDTLVLFETASAAASAPPPVRYAVRQVLDQEYQKNIIVRENAARQARYKAGATQGDDSEFSISDEKENRHLDVMESVVEKKKDFFGRPVCDEATVLQEVDGNANIKSDRKIQGGVKAKTDKKIWVTYHEGFSNAVRKPITIDELLKGL